MKFSGKGKLNKALKTAAILFTGGKDSCLALLKAKQQGYDVKYLLTILPVSYDSWMFHKPSLNLLREQARSLGLPLLIQKTKGEKESELQDLKILVEKVKGKVDYLVTGAVASNYQSKRIKKIANECGLKVLNPLWHMKSEDLWKEVLNNKFETVLTKISCEGIPASWLGLVIDNAKLEQLVKLSRRHGFSLEFEGGEAETSVLFMPLFKYRIRVEGRVKSESPYRHFLIIKRVGEKV